MNKTCKACGTLIGYEGYCEVDDEIYCIFCYEELAHEKQDEEYGN